MSKKQNEYHSPQHAESTTAKKQLVYEGVFSVITTEHTVKLAFQGRSAQDVCSISFKVLQEA